MKYLAYTLYYTIILLQIQPQYLQYFRRFRIDFFANICYIIYIIEDFISEIFLPKNGGTERAMKIAIGSDHGGVNHKDYIKQYLTDNGHEYVDFGTNSGESVDYPDIAETVAIAVRDEGFDCGILICGTGIGMSIAANKVSGVRAAHTTDTYSAKMAKQHNDAQIICLGERVTGPDLALDIVDTYLKQEHLGGRHTRRVEKIMAIEGK